MAKIAIIYENRLGGENFLRKDVLKVFNDLKDLKDPNDFK